MLEQDGVAEAKSRVPTGVVIVEEFLKKYINRDIKR